MFLRSHKSRRRVRYGLPAITLCVAFLCWACQPTSQSPPTSTPPPVPQVASVPTPTPAALLDPVAATLVEEGYQGYNLIQAGGRYFAIQQGTGPFDALAAAKHQYVEADSLDFIKRAVDLAAAFSREQEADASLPNDPVLVWPSYRGFNVVRFAGQTYAVPQDGSAFSTTAARDGTYLMAESVKALKPIIDASATQQLEHQADTTPDVPMLVEGTDSGYNLIRFQRRTYGIPQGEGSFDLGRFRGGAYPGALEGASAAEIRPLLPAAPANSQ